MEAEDICKEFRGPLSERKSYIYIILSRNNGVRGGCVGCLTFYDNLFNCLSYKLTKEPHVPVLSII